ncbi:zinc finger protein 723-like [Bombyx mori]|uniref:zinc finger protein 723-like n=1 Tax=Bombyx mori TaxID=7091 RepID=UPI002ECFB918
MADYGRGLHPTVERYRLLMMAIYALYRVARGTRIIRIEKQKPSIERNFVSSDKHTDVQQNKTNLINILLYSNANLFKSKDALGFECEFCLKRFPEAGALKTHFTNEYRKVKLSKTMLNNIFHRVVKVDATNLRCTICDSSIDKLHDMICHLKDLHRKSVFPDVKNLILPFKFDTVELRCAICGLEFAAFKRLQEHMHSHYPNYKCETCGAGFLTEQLKASHVRRHGTGQHKCDYCEKTFNNSQYKKIHVGRSHLGHTTPFKCTVCNERFAQLWKKNSHMVTAHGGEPVVIKCQACDRTFQSKQHLSVHTKRDHLLERRYECTECDKRFFMKSGLSRHMAKHGTLKQYKCDVCLKAFARKHTLREHIRIHMNDRRFACVHCGQAFVQKCSWKSHMRSKHGEIV